MGQALASRFLEVYDPLFNAMSNGDKQFFVQELHHFSQRPFEIPEQYTEGMCIINHLMWYACCLKDPFFARALIAHGGTFTRRELERVCEEGHLNMAKIICGSGVIPRNRDFHKAITHERYDIAFWFYCKFGLRGNETPEFTTYRVENMNEILIDTQTTIFRWVFPKICRNEAFIKKQAEKSWERWFEN